jgi:hypothetical protein
VSATETKGTALIISGGIGAIYADRRGYDLILVGGQPRPPRGADPAPEDETGRSGPDRCDAAYDPEHYAAGEQFGCRRNGTAPRIRRRED